jgi:hypothetical protein
VIEWCSIMKIEGLKKMMIVSEMKIVSTLKLAISNSG